MCAKSAISAKSPGVTARQSFAGRAFSIFVPRRLVWLCANMCELSELRELIHRDTLFLTKMIKMIKQLI
jgi:hypothetical protein